MTNLTARLSPSEPRRRRRTISPSGNAGRASRHEGGNCHLDDNVPPRRQRITCAEKRPGRAALRYHTRPPRRGIITGILGSPACRYVRRQGSPMPRIRQLTGGACGGVDSEENVSAPWKKNWRAETGLKRRPPDFQVSTRDRVKRVKPGPCRSAPARPLSRAPLDQAALTSIVLGVAARGAGTLTSSMPFAYFASTWAASTPSGRAKSRWNVPYATSRTK